MTIALSPAASTLSPRGMKNAVAAADRDDQGAVRQVQVRNAAAGERRRRVEPVFEQP